MEATLIAAILVVLSLIGILLILRPNNHGDHD